MIFSRATTNWSPVYIYLYKIKIKYISWSNSKEYFLYIYFNIRMYNLANFQCSRTPENIQLTIDILRIYNSIYKFSSLSDSYTSDCCFKIALESPIFYFVHLTWSCCIKLDDGKLHWNWNQLVIQVGDIVLFTNSLFTWHL